MNPSTDKEIELLAAAIVRLLDWQRWRMEYRENQRTLAMIRRLRKC